MRLRKGDGARAQFPDETLPEVSEETSKAIAGLEDPRQSLRPSEGHRATYLAMCAQEEIPPRQSVLDHLEEVRVARALLVLVYVPSLLLLVVLVLG